MSLARKCPQCDYEFKGNGWDGIDAHWRSKHEDIMTYEKFREFIRIVDKIKGGKCNLYRTPSYKERKVS